MSMLRIEEDDLAILEKTLPELTDALFTQMTPALRVKVRQIQRILTDVRWRYGPPSHVERVDVPPDGDDYADS